eukprot:CAMPEP_0198221104 /NCGR_PEP_ID=MMETSP1445-20131203/82149_1 /TAXON_ID=36898 /ORGANISM="Pyramimonas sp., Strain CCMP2087" /LENGTH=282 /DNA_ID=CAMNT_0043899103 /DNA_START=81 /DNA_END=925 /DNA_ORIENTATION=-
MEVAAELRACNPTTDRNLLLVLLREITRQASADEEFVHALGIGGGHSTLLKLVSSGDEEVQDAASESITVCVNNLPAGASFPMRGRPVDQAQWTPVIMQRDIGSPEAPLEVRLRQARELDGNKKIGNMLFTSSVLLARWITQNPAPFVSKSVLELGAGLGLAGIAAARFAKDCTLTDQAAMVPNIQYNISQNRSVIGQTDDRRVIAKVLDWTVDSGEHFNSGSTQVDVIIGADVVHEHWMAEAVCRMLRDYLCPCGVAFIMNPAAKSRAGVEEFQRLLVEAG